MWRCPLGWLLTHAPILSRRGRRAQPGCNGHRPGREMPAGAHPLARGSSGRRSRLRGRRVVRCELGSHAARHMHAVIAQVADESCGEWIRFCGRHRHQLSDPSWRERSHCARKTIADRTYGAHCDSQTGGSELRCRGGHRCPHDGLRADPGAGERAIEPGAEAVLRCEVNQRRTFKILQGHSRPCGQWMAGGCRQHDLFLGDGGGREAAGHGSGHQGQVGLVGVNEAVELVRRRGLTQGDRHLRVAAMPLSNDRGEHGDQALRTSQPQRPSGRFAGGTSRPHRRGSRFNRPSGIRYGGPPGGSEPDPSGLAAEQGRSCFALQRRELMRDGRLRRMQQPRGLGDRPGVRDRDKTLQRPKRSHSKTIWHGPET
ncbi:hypothetical protein SAMN05421874_101138 [Nonomuraea maritima]|uniref:Uncharacterized protein n=1 Tax=Nonomuraea maritima TaxID=683260 RepID=A0A1G8S1H0_9ACTN|nr:hypothetical protein SAMN05421874_101138 [Nonomuraea maritima]